MRKLTAIRHQAAATLQRLEMKDPGLRQLLKKAFGYAVFPSVGKASLVIGGSYGKGVVFQRGKLIGYATIGQTTVGVQIGGDTFTELIVLENREALERLKRSKLAFAADASAVLVKAGAAAARGFGEGTRAFVYGQGGMLLEAVIGGQKFSFKPAEEATSDERQEREEQHEQDASESSESKSAKAGQLIARAAGSVRSAASNVTDFARQHPMIATVAGVGAAAGAGLILFRMVRSTRGMVSEDGEQQSSEDQQEESMAGAE